MPDNPPFNDLTLYTWDTPNGLKPVIALEELGMSYRCEAIDMFSPVLKEAWYTDINPNGKIPALTDGRLKLFESGAILLYLCDQYDVHNRISFETGTIEYYNMVSWLVFQVAGLGPMQGQANWFRTMAPVYSEYAQKRYMDETRRLFSVIENRLEHCDWLAGDKYTVADIANYTWVRTAPMILDLHLDDFHNIVKWIDRIEARPAVRKAKTIPATGRNEEQIGQMFAEKRKQVDALRETDR